MDGRTSRRRDILHYSLHAFRTKWTINSFTKCYHTVFELGSDKEEERHWVATAPKCDLLEDIPLPKNMA